LDRPSPENRVQGSKNTKDEDRSHNKGRGSAEQAGVDLDNSVLMCCAPIREADNHHEHYQNDKDD
jgi:hypothetical protein